MQKKGQKGPRPWLESENLAPGKQADLVLIKGDPFVGITGQSLSIFMASQV